MNLRSFESCRKRHFLLKIFKSSVTAGMPKLWTELSQFLKYDFLIFYFWSLIRTGDILDRNNSKPQFFLFFSEKSRWLTSLSALLVHEHCISSFLTQVGLVEVCNKGFSDSLHSHGQTQEYWESWWESLLVSNPTRFGKVFKLLELN